MLGEIMDAGMGDIVCGPGEYESGLSAFVDLKQYFLSLDDSTRAHYATAFKALIDEGTAVFVDGSATDPTLFCRAKTFGQKAQALTQQIAKDTGQAPIAEDPNLRAGFGIDLPKVGDFFTYVLVAGGLFVAYEVFKKKG